MQCAVDGLSAGLGEGERAVERSSLLDEQRAAVKESGECVRRSVCAAGDVQGRAIGNGDGPGVVDVTNIRNVAHAGQ